MFRQVCAMLKSEYPAKHPVRIYIVPGMEDYGDCELKRNGRKRWFTIRIRKTDIGIMIHTLLEEYAHALAWFEEKQDHDKAWACRYSAVRQWWESVNGG